MSQAIGPQMLPTVAPPTVAEETLDPADWKLLRVQGHRMLDDMFDYLENIRERPVWQPMPEQVRERFSGDLPRSPADLAAVHDEFLRDVLPFAAGNVHPGFMGWVHGGGTAVGMLAEMLAGGLNANLGGRDHAPIEVERQIAHWMRALFGFPDQAAGLFVTGTSMANLIAVIVARDVALGVAVRQRGVAVEERRLTAYASSAAHGCIAKALDLCGLGSDALRSIPTDARHRINLYSLEAAIHEDWEAGRTPFLVVGTAGTVDTGAIDDLAGIADLCAAHKLWFHVDGAYGALAKLSAELAPRLDGIERADSLAFDFHKWGQVPYDAGYILVRDGQLQRNAFATAAAYLRRGTRGLAAGTDWPCDFGPDLSRGFRGLKTWFTFKVYGADALGAMIERACELARYLEGRVAATPELELLAPVELNIVCFRYRAEDNDTLNEQIVVLLQESGIAAPSTTRVGGRLAIRAAIVNHRTTRTEIDALVEHTVFHGRALAANLAKPVAAPKTLWLDQANLLIERNQPEQARELLERALTSDPNNRAVHWRLATVFSNLGDAARASQHRRKAFKGRCIIPLTCRSERPRMTILELLGTDGNFSAQSLLGDDVCRRYLIATEFYDSATPLPPHDLVVNMIGDADLAVSALAGARRVIANSVAPVINRPEAVLATGRCEIARRLSALPGVVAARTVALPRTALASPDALAILSHHGLAFPLLVRAPGFHGGQHFVRLEAASELPGALATLPGDKLLVLECLDARGADGNTRKYRVMMIDGRLYPLHLAIAKHWKVHYFSAEMESNPQHRAEEAEFLGDMEAALGPRAMTALRAIQRTLRLDYAGIDFGLNAKGDVLLFEANATMAILHPDADARWDYRRPAINRACEAVRQMLFDRAASARAQPDPRSHHASNSPIQPAALPCVGQRQTQIP